MLDHRFLTGWPLAVVFVAVLCVGTKHLVRFASCHLYYIELRSRAQGHGSYTDQGRREADIYFTDVKEWLCHVMINWDDFWIGLTWNIRLLVSRGHDAAIRAYQLNFDVLVMKIIFSFTFGAEVKHYCSGHDRSVEGDLQPVVSIPEEGVYSLARTPCELIFFVKTALTNLCKDVITLISLRKKD